MNKSKLLDLISQTIGKYEEANKYLHIQDFQKDDKCCWCIHSRKHTKEAARPHNHSHRCTACPMLRTHSPSYVVDCSDMYTYGLINPVIKDTWQLRLKLWKMAKVRVEAIQDPAFFELITNITNLIWEIDDEIRANPTKFA